MRDIATQAFFTLREGSKSIKIDWSYSYVEEGLPVKASYTGRARVDSEIDFHAVVAFCDDGGINLICADDAELKTIWDFAHVAVDKTPEEEALRWATAWIAQAARRHYDIDVRGAATVIQHLKPG